MAGHGFSPVGFAGYTAAWRGGYHVLRIDYDASRSRELAIWFDEAGSFRSPLGLGDLLRAAGCPEHDVTAVEAAQPDDETALRAVLERVGLLMRRYGIPYLSGNPLAFARAVEVRREREHALDALAQRAGPQARADEAWQAKDYETVRRLLAPVRDILDPVHKRRLAYVERKTHRSATGSEVED
ncbi:MAG: hypothetical protein JW940_01560 [Polyangiaceae bacterium]|nr:hypothetical protein [Polyangiaceae bacterium]